jgi:hypothetical protein
MWDFYKSAITDYTPPKKEEPEQKYHSPYNIWDGEEWESVEEKKPTAVTAAFNKEDYEEMLLGKKPVNQKTFSQMTKRQLYAVALRAPLELVLKSKNG